MSGPWLLTWLGAGNGIDGLQYRHSFGLGQPVSTSRIAPVLQLCAGAALIVLGQKGAADNVAPSKLGLIGLALLAGAVLPVQGAVNALLRGDLGGAPFAVGTISFLVAMLAMAAVLLATLALSKAPRPRLAG